MSLYIRDPDVAALAAKLQDLTGSRTKTEAVRLALQQAIERAHETLLRPAQRARPRNGRRVGLHEPRVRVQSVLRSDVGRGLMVLDASAIPFVLTLNTSAS